MLLRIGEGLAYGVDAAGNPLLPEVDSPLVDKSLGAEKVRPVSIRCNG
jgi:hypothetical protein